MTQCIARKPDGSSCSARPAAESQYCFFHDPERKLERRQAQGRGGRHSHRRPVFEMSPASAPADISLRTPNDIINTLDHTVKLVVRGEMDAPRAYLITAMANCALKAHVVDITEQLEQLK